MAAERSPMGELAAAIREGRIDNQRAVILRFQGPR
jgi:hypothetical protein